VPTLRSPLPVGLVISDKVLLYCSAKSIGNDAGRFSFRWPVHCENKAKVSALLVQNVKLKREVSTSKKESRHSEKDLDIQKWI
jgi:hypothetical protein